MIAAFTAQPCQDLIGSLDPVDGVVPSFHRFASSQLQDRDTARLGEAMATLDRDRDLSQGEGRQGRPMLATALFDRIDLLECARRRSLSAPTRSAMGWRRSCRLSSIHP
jgi:hypothetical protein